MSSSLSEDRQELSILDFLKELSKGFILKLKFNGLNLDVTKTLKNEHLALRKKGKLAKFLFWGKIRTIALTKLEIYVT